MRTLQQRKLGEESWGRSAGNLSNQQNIERKLSQSKSKHMQSLFECDHRVLSESISQS